MCIKILSFENNRQQKTTKVDSHLGPKHFLKDKDKDGED